MLVATQRFATPLLIGAGVFFLIGIACAAFDVGALAVALLVFGTALFVVAMVAFAATSRADGTSNREIALRIAAFVVLASLAILVVAYIGDAKAMIGTVSPALHHGGVHVLPSVLYVVLIGILGIVFGALCFAMRREVEPLAVDIDGIVTHAVSVAVTDVRRAFDAKEARYRAALAAALARAHRQEAAIAAPSPSPIAHETAPITRTAAGESTPEPSPLAEAIAAADIIAAFKERPHMESSIEPNATEMPLIAQESPPEPQAENVAAPASEPAQGQQNAGSSASSASHVESLTARITDAVSTGHERAQQQSTLVQAALDDIAEAVLARVPNATAQTIAKAFIVAQQSGLFHDLHLF